MYRKGVSALILNKNQELLLVNLVAFENQYYAIPGGGVEEGETLEDAVYREIKEELGIEKNTLKYIAKSDNPLRFKFKVTKVNREGREYSGSERYFFGFNFIGDDENISIQESEVRSYKWVPFSDLGKYLLFDNQLAESLVKITELFPSIK